MNEPLDDTQLMALIKEGNTNAFQTIMQRHQVSLLNFFRRLDATIDEAEDCAQETFIKLYNYRRKYRPINLQAPPRTDGVGNDKTVNFTTFLYTLARHTWIDKLRRQKRYEAYVLRLASDVPHAVSDEGHKTLDALDIQMALGKLSEKLRMTVVLSVYQGLNYEEIAQVLDIPLGTVKSRMSLAFEELRKVLHYDQ